MGAIKYSATLLLLLLSCICLAQDATTPRSQSLSEQDGPEFVLLGYTRIGSRYSVTLQHRDGGRTRFAGQLGFSKPILGYSSFSLLNVESGKVSIQHPIGMPCFEYPELGVSCGSAQVSQLQLVAGVLDRVNDESARQPVIPAEENLSSIPSSQGSLIDSLQAEAEQRGETARVPPGMELISTPGGYRLVPDD